MTFQPAPVTPADPAPPPASVATPRRRTGRLLDLALGVAAVLAIAGVAFAIGRATAPPSAATGFAPGGATFVRPGGSFDPSSGPGPRLALAGGGLTIDGTVIAIDADSITVKTSDGQERTFVLDGSTAYHQASDAAASDVSVGDDVSVKVSPNGQVTAPTSSGEAPDLPASEVTLTR
jgi:hypothetical protein